MVYSPRLSDYEILMGAELSAASRAALRSFTGTLTVDTGSTESTWPPVSMREIVRGNAGRVTATGAVNKKSSPKLWIKNMDMERGLNYKGCLGQQLSAPKQIYLKWSNTIGRKFVNSKKRGG